MEPSLIMVVTEQIQQQTILLTMVKEGKPAMSHS
jgi:hypothetical protein